MLGDRFVQFGAQNRILASKIALLGPELHFCPHFAPWPKRFIKQRVSGLLFRTFGAKMQKWAPFCTSGSQNVKMSTFCTFGAKSAKMSSFSVFGSQSAQKGSSNHWFNKLFVQGREITPKVHFWAQNCILLHSAPWSERLMTRIVSAPFFCSWGSECEIEFI